MENTIKYQKICQFNHCRKPGCPFLHIGDIPPGYGTKEKPCAREGCTHKHPVCSRLFYQGKGVGGTLVAFKKPSSKTEDATKLLIGEWTAELDEVDLQIAKLRERRDALQLRIDAVRPKSGSDSSAGSTPRSTGTSENSA